MIEESEQAEIVLLCDEHLGNVTQQYKFLEYAIDYIAKGKNRYWIYLGDGAENNLEGSAGGAMNQTMTPKKQLKTFVKMHKPIVDKCIAFNTHSNHGNRTTKKTTLNPDEILAERLGLPFTLPTDEAQIRVGDRIFDIVHSHGATGATTLGGKVNAMMKYPLHYDADIYLMAHVHTLLQWKQWRIKHNRYREYALMIGGSFVDYFNSYGQVKNYPPNPAQFGSLFLTEDGVKFNHFVNLDPIINLDY